MQTEIPKNLLATADGQKANNILRSCVHCGFCLATCPTYQLLGSELDSPRGRIYLIKSALENKPASAQTLVHLDRCLTCRSCESTCPSGVEYGQLLDIGRTFLEPKRHRLDKLKRFVVRKALTTPRFISLVGTIAKHSPITTKPSPLTLPKKGKVLLLSGCIQPGLAPNINASALQVLMRLGFLVVQSENGQCCGAIDLHLSARKDALKKVRVNLDDWYEKLANGIDTIISTASGCGAMVKDYTHLFDKNDPYHQKAQTIAQATQDIGEFIAQNLSTTSDKTKQSFKNHRQQTIGLHTPCTLAHAQQLPDLLPQLLSELGYQITQPNEDHLCCGSAGTYSIFQPRLAKQLRARKLSHLQAREPELIVTANIGCLLHLQNASKTPVKHWIELLAQ